MAWSPQYNWIPEKVRQIDPRDKWYAERMFLMAPAQAIVANEIQTLREFPPRQKPGSFSLGDAMEKLQNAGQNNDN